MQSKTVKAMASMKTRKLFTVVPMADANGALRRTFVSLHKGTPVNLFKSFDLNPHININPYISVDVDIIHWINGPVPFRLVAGSTAFCATYNDDNRNYELRFPFGFPRYKAQFNICKIHVEPKFEQEAADACQFMVEAEVFDKVEACRFRHELQRAGWL